MKMFEKNTLLIIFLMLVNAVVFSAALGVRVIGINDGQVGIEFKQGDLNEQLLPPGIYVHVPRFRHIEVVFWGQVRISRFNLHGKNKSGEQIRQRIWLQWWVNSEKVVQFYRATREQGLKSNGGAEAALIQAELDTLVASYSGDLKEIRDKLQQALGPQGFVINDVRLVDEK